MTAVLVVDALNMAAWVRRGVDIDGVICHSDPPLALRPVTACLRRPQLAFPAGWEPPVRGSRRPHALYARTLRGA
jgi:hypothetical protein